MHRTILIAVILPSMCVSAILADRAPAPIESLAISHPLLRVSAPSEGRRAEQLSDYEASLVAWAESRFTQADLALPRIAVEFDPTRKACDGAEGRYRFDGIAHSVAICTWESSSFAADLHRRRTLLHEFAHAWETVNLSDTERQMLNQRFGTTAWSDLDDQWENRGSEHLAETFVFGLLHLTRRKLKIDRQCAQLVFDFQAISNTAVLGPDLPWCLQTAVAGSQGPSLSRLTDEDHAGLRVDAGTKGRIRLATAVRLGAIES